MTARPGTRRGRSGLARITSVFSWAVLLYLNLPVFVIAFMSFARGPFLSFPPSGFSLHWYGNYLLSARWMAATATSLEVATIAAGLSLILGISAAFGLVRTSPACRRASHALIGAPLIVPGIVSAVGFYFFFAKLNLIGTRSALVLADTLLAAPLVFGNIATAMRTLDANLAAAASGLGAGRWDVLRHVTLPLLAPTIVASGLLAFLLSFDELIVALFISGVDTTTLPVRLWNSLRDELDPTVAAASTFLVGVPIAILGVIEVLRRRITPLSLEGG